MAYINIAYLWHFRQIFPNADFIYHFNRIRGIRNNLLYGQFPFINQGTSVPYGTILTYYPWLTLIPIVLLSFVIKNPVTIFYVSIGLIWLLTYLISYYSCHVVHKSWAYDFIFALFYTNSSLIFDWAFREGDIGAILAVSVLPLAYFGLLNLLKNNRGCLMLGIGVGLSVSSHIITGGLSSLILSILGLLNIKQLNIKGFVKALGSILTALIITSLFWYPDLLISSQNNLSMPFKPNGIGDGLINNIGTTCNYLYAMVELIGLCSIFKFQSHNFHLFDFEEWLFGLGAILINVKFIAHIATSIFPILNQLQFSYRFGLIAHLMLVPLAVKFVCGKYKLGHMHIRLPLEIISLMLIFTPLLDEVDYHFLMNNRPFVNGKNFDYINKKYDGQYKMDLNSFRALQHGHYNYDYASNKEVANNESSDIQYMSNIYDDNGHWVKTKKYLPKKSGIVFNNDYRYKNIQYPIMVYHGIRYQFNLNGHKMPKKYINKKLTWKNYELTLHNLPKGKDKVSIRSASLK